MDSKSVTNHDIFKVWKTAKTNSKKHSAVKDYILNKFNLYESSNNVTKSIDKLSKFLCFKIKTYWSRSYRNETKFIEKNRKWLSQEIVFDQLVTNFLKTLVPSTSNINHRGRPQKKFNELSHGSKKRRVANIRETHSHEEITFAASLHKSNTETKCLSAEKALALQLDLGLTVRKYNILRSVVNSLHPNTFPSHHSVKNLKKQILPEGITVSEYHAEVDLQSLLNKTTASILTLCKGKLANEELYTLKVKWGFDGSSSHSTYKQKFSDVQRSDEFIFFVALSPICLINDTTGDIIWENEVPSSTMFCRPIKFIFVKECPSVVKEEHNRVQDAIRELSPFQDTSDINTSSKVSFELFFTMIDGSICNVISETNSAQTCYICGAKPKDMNKEGVENRPVITERYRFGLQLLHCWIRCFECLLHIAYRLDLKTWQVKGNEAKQIFNSRKSTIQTAFKEKLGLRVDQPKPGYGSTNDGNTARIFFLNPMISANVTGLDVNLIVNLSKIIRIMHSGKHINLTKFRDILKETKELYLKNYSWYYMPVSLHKILVHGADIISSFSLPIGQLSEEALECRHKDIRKYRQSFTRKTSRCATNKDLMGMLLLTSDPRLSSLRHNKSNRAIKEKDELSGSISEYFFDRPRDETVEDLNLLDISISSSDESSSEEVMSDSD